MKPTYVVQKANSPYPKTINCALEKHVNAVPYDQISIAMAYVSIAGIRALLNIFSKQCIISSKWLVGLDDAITQPGAIDLLMKLENAEVRVAALNNTGYRFHPKICRFECSSKINKNLLMIGSANLTRSALLSNSEAVVFLHSNNIIDRKLITNMWDELWSQGMAPTKEILDDYRLQYSKTTKKSKFKKPMPKKAKIKTSLVLESDDSELDPSCANTCWIECGYITAMGRELEFKAEQGLFFDLKPSGETSKIFQFRTSNGSIVNLRMKYQQNHMWRLQMNNEVPEVAHGLRPTMPGGKLGRSPYVAVFKRTEVANQFDIRFIELKSPSFAKLMKMSEQKGSVGNTSARCYGWC